MDTFFFRIFNALVLRFDSVDAVIFFLAQPAALLLVLCLAGFAAREIVREKKASAQWLLIEKWALVFFAAVLAWMLGGLVKDIVAAPRPFLDLADANLLFPQGDHDSFPSGHVAFLSALAGALYLFRSHRLAYSFAAGAVLVGFARVAAGIHWPSDIIAGVVLGIAVAWGVFRTRKYFK